MRHSFPKYALFLTRPPPFHLGFIQGSSEVILMPRSQATRYSLKRSCVASLNQYLPLPRHFSRHGISHLAKAWPYLFLTSQPTPCSLTRSCATSLAKTTIPVRYSPHVVSRPAERMARQFVHNSKFTRVPAWYRSSSSIFVCQSTSNHVISHPAESISCLPTN